MSFASMAAATPNMQFARASEPSFGSVLGSQATRMMEPIFRNSADIIWEMLILDVFALWIPRIVNAMDRGSEKTHLNEITSDPKYRSESSGKQIRTWLHKNIKGLNWSNGVEETWREIQSVPMILGAQSMFYGIAMLDDPLGKGILLSKSDLDSMTKAFTKHMRDLGPQQLEALVKQRDGGFRRLANSFTSSLLTPHFKEFGQEAISYDYLKGNMAPSGLTWVDTRALNKSTKTLAASPKKMTMDWLSKHFGSAVETTTYNQALERWVADWGKTMPKNAKYNHYVKPLETVLDQLVKNYNERLIVKIPDLAMDTIRMPLVAEGHKNAGQFVECLDKFTDFAKAAYKQTAKAVNEIKVSEPALSAFEKTTETLRRQLVTRKGLYSVGVMGVGILLYFASSLHAQSNNAYPANRLYHSGKDPNPLPDAHAIGNRLSQDVLPKKLEAAR